MKAVEFCYWLQGMFEIADPKELNEHQTECIKRHLNMVFYHEIDKLYPEGEQQHLNELHDPKEQKSFPKMKDSYFTMTEEELQATYGNNRPRC